MDLFFKWSIRRFAAFQFTIVSLLILAGAGVYIYAYRTGDDYFYSLLPLLNVGGEMNIPTFFSAANLLLAGFLSYCASKAGLSKKRMAPIAWLVLSIIFVYLSIDEACSIHERLKFAADNFPKFDFVHPRHLWLVPGALLALVLLALVAPLLFAVPRRTALWLFLAGCIFIAGVFGMELVGSWMLRRGFHPDGVAYVTRRVVEEALEMCGIAFYNCVVFAELARRRVTVGFRLISSQEVTSPVEGS